MPVWDRLRAALRDSRELRVDSRGLRVAARRLMD